MSIPFAHEGKIKNDDIPTVRQRLCDAFAANITRSYEWRQAQISAILDALTRHKDSIIEAVAKDLGRHAFEIITSEINVCKVECETMLENLSEWMQPEKVPSNIATLPGSSWIYRDPFGVVLIVSPWNYPVQLSLVPLIGALAAGNAVYLKLSRHSPNTSACLERLLLASLDRRAVAIESEGGANTITALNHQKWDHVFFTGSVSVGRIVYESAAKHLTPCTLELGGKNPCIVDTNMDLSLAAKRIAWAKFFNCGQTCITVDYILVVGEARRNELVRHLKNWITSFYGWNPRLSDSYGKIVSVDHAKRLENLFSCGTVVHGGIAIPDERYVAPTLITNPQMDSLLMQDEIFGPIIPIIAVKSITEAVQFVNARPHALALYVFSEDEEVSSRVLRDTRSGAALVNECLLHPSNHHLPFGGVGASGLGNYHGFRSFKTFTHERAVIKQTSKWWLDVPLRYPPYSNVMTKLADIATSGALGKFYRRLKLFFFFVILPLIVYKRKDILNYLMSQPRFQTLLISSMQFYYQYLKK